MIDLTPHHLETVKRILAEHLSGCEVRAFGSRATWTAREYSDLDLAVVSPEPLAWDRRSRLREAFEQSDLPIRVDVVDWESLSDGFRQTIDGDCVVLQEAATTRDWRETTLGDVVELNPKRSLKRGEDAPFVAMADVQEHQRQLPKLSTREFKGSGSRFRNGDTLLARITPCLENGKTAWVSGLVDDEIGHGSTEFIVLSAIDGLTDPLFVYYLARHPDFRQFSIGQMTGTSGRQRVPVAAIESFEFSIPPLDEQRRIAHILGTLDDKIELNRRMSQTLEAMAQALFKSWFVDFDPVQAKAEGRPTGLPPEIDALLPDSFQDSELGEIPSGWEVATLGDICHKPQYGYTQSARSEQVGPKFLRITDINKQPWIEWDSVPHCEITPQNTKKYRLHHGDILIARMADPGHGCMIEGNPDAVFASYLIRFRPKHERYARYLQYWLRSANYWELVRGRRTGTTRANLNAKALRGFPLVVPPPRVLEKFATQVDELRARVVANVAESHSLAVQRDTLLPSLMSCEAPEKKPPVAA